MARAGISLFLKRNHFKHFDYELFMTVILADLGYNKEVPVPDISTKAKAQDFIGLDMEKRNRQKEQFMEQVVPKWEEQAKEREQAYDVKKVED